MAAVIPPHASNVSGNAKMALSGLARSLIQAGRLTAEQVEKVNQEALAQARSFIESLIKSQLMSSSELALFCADTFGYPLVDLTLINPATLPEKLIDARLMVMQQVVVLARRGNKLFIAQADPSNSQALDQIKFQTTMMVEPVIVDYLALDKYLHKLAQDSDEDFSPSPNEVDDTRLEAAEEDLGFSETSDSEEAPIVRFLQKVLKDAIRLGASDLHFEPFEKFYRIRFRVDGVLREIAQPPMSIKEKLASRIKVISRLDISEKRVPQDGRMRLVVSKTRTIDFRVSTLPTLHGEKIVMRILDASQAQLGIDALGYDPDQKALLLEAIHRPYGMVLVTGPTGSGKTVSLYTYLNILNQPGINIATAEDPAEINLPGINQVNVNDRAGLTFPIALRAFLRQDPDIIMVGEIRDLETADISIKAAQTGHMVFSTLHTNDAPSTLTRLMNMGVAPFNIASSVIMITAQRLARRLCSCKEPADISEDVLIEAGMPEDELDGSWQPFRAVGCELCSGSGFKGRVGIYQVMPISEAIERIILSHGTSLEIEAQAKQDGVRTLRESGMLKVKQGMTTIEEVLGCTNL